MTDDEIQLALNNNGLDIRMDVDEDNPAHLWFKIALAQGKQLCARSGLPLTFTFNCGQDIQAYAVYRSNLVVVSAACFDFICRLAERIVSRGIYQREDISLPPNWKPSPENMKQSIRDLIKHEPFSASKLDLESNHERKELFSFLMITIFRFVVLHEIGHFHHKHGRRFLDEKANLDVDAAQPRQLPEGEALDSQARELVADKFAADILDRILEDEISGLRQLPKFKSFARKHLETRIQRVCFILQMAYVYFVATDRLPVADAKTLLSISHPPAAFRLTTIVATAVTGFNNENDIKMIHSFIVSADAIIAVTLDRIPNVDWLAQLDHANFSEHYKKLYDRVDSWAISPQKAILSEKNFL